MISDIWTVMWKERKGIFRLRGSRMRTVLSLFVPVIVIGIYLPWQRGSDWLDSPLSLISVLIPMTVVAMTISDSFAGERERHTLGTLLASRLSDRAILFGKLALAVALGWGMTIATLIVGLVTVNVTQWNGGFLFYSPTMALADLGLGLIAATLVASAGVLISLRSSTVQEAQQIIMVTMLVPPLVLGVIATLLHEQIARALGSLSSMQVVLIIGAILAVAAVGLLLAAMTRFKRARLILD